MSTGHMPDPPNNLINQATQDAVKGQTTAPPAPGAQAPSTGPAAAPDQQAEAQPQPQLPISDDIARIFEEQVGTIAQRLIYHSQMLFGVGGLGTDPVSARDATLVVASALRDRSAGEAVHALVNLGDAQIVQINDRTMPYRFNSQVAGLLEGILASTVANEYRDDPDRLKQARTLLNGLFVTANEQLQVLSKVIPMMSQAPAMGNEFRQLTDTQAGTQSVEDAPAVLAPRSTDEG